MPGRESAPACGIRRRDRGASSPCPPCPAAHPDAACRARRAVMPCTKSKIDLRRPAFLEQHGLDDLRGLGLARSRACAGTSCAVLVVAGDDPLPRRLDAVDERHGRGVGELDQRRLRFVRETRGRIFGMPDGDLLEIFHAPQIAVLAHRAEIEAGDPEGAGRRLPSSSSRSRGNRDRASRPAACPASIGLRSSTRNRKTSRSDA